MSAPDTSDSAAQGLQRLSILTLNVHGWHNEEVGSFKALVAMLKEKQPDIIALQEATKHRVPQLAAALTDGLSEIHWTVTHNCAILSRFPLGVFEASRKLVGPQREARITGGKGSPRYSVATVTPCDGVSIEIVCLHLDHVREPTRLVQLRKLADAQLAPGRGALQIWLGDFNALTQSDVSEKEWQAIAEHRSRNAWEAPVSDVTSMMSSLPASAKRVQAPRAQPKAACLNFTDCWRAAEQREGGLGTSRFGTRIDYIYCTAQLMQRARVASCEHVQTIPAQISDHNGVLATLELAPVEIGRETL